MILLINKKQYAIKIHHIYYKMNFDLDIHNYSKSDLEDLLDLKYPYASDDVTTKCTVFQESVVNNSTLDMNFTRKISTFLDNVKIKLTSNSSSNNDLLSHRNFENPRLSNSKVLQIGNTQIIEQNLRDSSKASDPSTTALTSSLSYNLAADEAPGKMNPLYKRTINKCLNIDSRFRESYYKTTSSNFLLSLPMKFSNVIQLQLSEIELPLTFYAISKSLKNNYFWIRMVVNDLNKSFFNFNFWKIGKYEGSEWNMITTSQELIATSIQGNGLNVIAYTMIEIPDGNYIHTDIVKFLNQTVNSRFTVSTNDTPEYAQLIKFTIDINQGGSGSGKTIVSSTTYAFDNPFIPEQGTPTEPLESGNLNQPLGTIKGIPAASTRFELNFSAPHIGYKPGSQDWINIDFNTLQDTYSEISTNPLPLGFGWILGFRFPLYTSYNKLTDPFNSQALGGTTANSGDESKLPGCTYLSEGFFECHGPRYLFLVVDDFNNNVNTNMFSAFNSSILSKNILARISIKGTVFSILSDDSKHITSTVREYFGPVNIEKLRIQLLDEYGRILEMNNMDFSMALNIKSVYDS